MVKKTKKIDKDLLFEFEEIPEPEKQEKKSSKKKCKKKRKDKEARPAEQVLDTKVQLTPEMSIFMHMSEKVLNRMSEDGLSDEDYRSLKQMYDSYSENEMYRREFATRFECARDVYHHRPDDSALCFYIVSMFFYFLAALTFCLSQTDGNKPMPLYGGLVFLLVATSLLVLFRVVRKKIDVPDNLRNIERFYCYIHNVDSGELLESLEPAPVVNAIRKRLSFLHRSS
ncbi:hypothetical protein Corgl_0478 [Coriobacterium glomerans PW2]|uniref:Uncharacterized protein n=1 Tax=Coriobacterium glomerans (strain ATCC 49209 / DSM 20642 / JCM 10262 / PW2) TaxID=700015 RepID=F2N7C1_CORGP|nr:hypothetical protein [Coriobacterium glomerans]AEB06596.1 hypothetical protein Corgl_0478 [Coriobacterium glomerans PW2]